jgi:hypothetical protein
LVRSTQCRIQRRMHRWRSHSHLAMVIPRDKPRSIEDRQHSHARDNALAPHRLFLFGRQPCLFPPVPVRSCMILALVLSCPGRPASAEHGLVWSGRMSFCTPSTARGGARLPPPIMAFRGSGGIRGWPADRPPLLLAPVPGALHVGQRSGARAAVAGLRHGVFDGVLLGASANIRRGYIASGDHFRLGAASLAVLLCTDLRISSVLLAAVTWLRATTTKRHAWHFGEYGAVQRGTCILDQAVAREPTNAAFGPCTSKAWLGV